MCFETSWEQKSETINDRNKTRTVLESSLISAQIHEDFFFNFRLLFLMSQEKTTRSCFQNTEKQKNI